MKPMRPAEAEHGVVWRQTPTTCFKYNGWPSVTRDENGVLYAAASSMRLTHVDPVGKNCMWVSRDEGKTWTPPIVVNDSYFDDRDTGITYAGNGRLVMTWFTSFYRDYCQSLIDAEWFGDRDKSITRGFAECWRHISDEEKREYTGTFVKISEDYGVTWSENIRVPLTAPHGCSVCSDGRLIYMGKEHTGDFRKPSPIALYESRDGGYHWDRVGTIPEGADTTYRDMHEPHVVELQSGRLLGAIRVHGRSSAPENSVYLTHSDDGGKTWTVPECLGVDGMPPHLLVNSSGAIICSYGCRNPDAPDGRSESAVVSYDGGETWTEDYFLAPCEGPQFDLGYPASVELSDGSILTVYYQALPGEWHTSVLYTKWKLNR